MTFYLCRPEGIDWTEGVSIAKAYSDKYGLITPVTDSMWRNHAKWLVKPERRHNFDLTIKEVDQHIPDAPGREWFRTSPDEIRQIIESIHPGVRIQNIPTTEETYP